MSVFVMNGDLYSDKQRIEMCLLMHMALVYKYSTLYYTAWFKIITVYVVQPS